MAKGRAFAKPLKATRTEYNGVEYDSKAEAARARVLDKMIESGAVSLVLRQVGVDVGEAGIDKPYRVDSLVFAPRPDGSFDAWCEDPKGCDSPTFRRHCLQWARRGGLPLRVIRRGKVAETVEGGRLWLPSERDGTRVDGIDYGSVARAQRARYLGEARRSGDVVQWFRNVKTGRPDVPKLDFLTLYRAPDGGVRPAGEIVSSRPISPAAVESWRAFGPFPLVVRDGGTSTLISSLWNLSFKDPHPCN